MSAADQAAVLAGKHVPAFRDPVAEVATTNLATFEAHAAELAAAIDAIHADRADTDRRLSGSA